jgi:plastocyanin
MDMNPKTLRTLSLSIFAVLILAAAGCAGRATPVKMTAAPGKKTVAMTAGNFKFEPSAIEALRGDTLVFEIANTSSTTHNFTIKDPGGHIIESVDLPGKKSVSVEIPLPEPGTYEFYCDKPFHPAMGMKGRVHALLP